MPSGAGLVGLRRRILALKNKVDRADELCIIQADEYANCVTRFTPVKTGTLRAALLERTAPIRTPTGFRIGVGNKRAVGNLGEKSYEPHPIARFLEMLRQQGVQGVTPREQRAGKVAARKAATAQKKADVEARKADRKARGDARRASIQAGKDRKAARKAAAEEPKYDIFGRIESAADKKKRKEKLKIFYGWVKEHRVAEEIKRFRYQAVRARFNDLLDRMADLGHPLHDLRLEYQHMMDARAEPGWTKWEKQAWRNRKSYLRRRVAELEAQMADLARAKEEMEKWMEMYRKSHK